MKGTLVLLAVLFLAGQVTAASRGLVSRMRRNTRAPRKLAAPTTREEVTGQNADDLLRKLPGLKSELPESVKPPAAAQ